MGDIDKALETWVVEVTDTYSVEGQGKLRGDETRAAEARARNVRRRRAGP